MKKKLLVVDDQPEVRELVAVTLDLEDFEILQAESGDMAVEVARRERPDVIIMDVMMPGTLDGVAATRVLKEDPTTKHAKIIMLTAKGQMLDRQKGTEAGADDYFAKPFSPLDLINKVEEVMGT